MGRVVLKTDIRNERSAKKIRKRLVDYIHGVERAEASVDSGLVMVWGSADAETVRSVTESLNKKPVTIVSEEGVAAEESPPPAAPSSSGPPPAAPSQLTPGPPPQYYPQPMWPPPPQYYQQPPPPPEYYQYQQPPPPQYYQPPSFDHPQYGTPAPPPPYSTPEGGSYGYHNYNPHLAGHRHDENPSGCSIQ